MRKLVFLALTALGVSAFAEDDLHQPVDQSAADQPTAVAAQSAGAEHINYLHQRGWVRLGHDGNIAGKLLVLDESGHTEGRIGAKIIVSRAGRVVLETTTDVGGEFSLQGLEPGAYAIQGRGDYTFAANALHVLPSQATHLSSDLEVYASVIPEAVATQLLTNNLVPSDLAPISQAYYRSHVEDPIASERKFNNSHRVALRDGVLVGRVSRPGWSYAEQDLSGTIAQIVQAGEVVAKAAVGADGYYEVSGIQPGVYDLFVSGNDGFAVLAFEAVLPTEPLAATAGAIHMVSAHIGVASDCLCCELIQQPEINACSSCAAPLAVEEFVVVEEPCGLAVGACGLPGAPACGGGYGGGFGGGFGGGHGLGRHGLGRHGFGGGGGGGGALGGGGGLGGLGGLMGIAGLAVGVTALADDDSGFVVPPVTPVK